MGFGYTTYFAYGDELNKPLITSVIGDDNIIVQIIKFTYCINLVITYPLQINIANEVIE